MFRSITTKLFVIIAVVFVVVIGSMLLIQSAFFEDYYKDQKSKAVDKYTSELTALYTTAEDRFSADISDKVDEYSQKYGINIIYLETITSTDDTTLLWGTLSTTSVAILSASKNPETTDNRNFISNQLSKGEDLYLKNKPKMDAGEHLFYSAKDDAGNTVLITLSSIVVGGTSRGLLYVFSSLQPVGEAVAVIRDYYLIYFCAAIVVTLALSFWVSKQITRPLIHINNVASSIANLNFSQECTIKSNDELGNLSQTVNQLSANLSHNITELKKSNEKLALEIAKQKELEEMRKLFVAGVSHELKTPLSVIKGYTEGVIDGAEKGEIKKDYIYIIQDETEKMNQIVSDMLDLAQMESGKYQLNIEDISINRMVKYELKKISPLVEKKRIQLTVNIPNEPITVLGDSLRIEQVFANLIQNAIWYTPENGKICLSVSDMEKNILVEVENNCDEISQEDLGRIWDQFYRVEKSRNKELGGTGLGLTVVKNILELHHSQFGVQKTEDGIKFYFVMEKSKNAATQDDDG